MATINVLDSSGSVVAVQLPQVIGRASAANSKPVVLSNEDLAAVQAITTTLGTPFQAGGVVTANLGTLNGAATATGVAAVVTALGTPYQAGGALPLPTGAATNASVLASVADVNVAATGITIQNSVPGGAATAGSAVAITPAGRAALTIQVTGTYTGALSVQGTVDGTNWVTLGGTPIFNVNTGLLSATIASAATGIYQVEASGFTQVRVTALAAVTGTATVSINASFATPLVTIDAALPTGTNTIGNLNTVGTITTITTSNIQPLPQTGLNINSAATTNATSVKATSGQLLTLNLSNNGAAAAFVKLYNKASAPTVGTDTPVMVIPIPASGFVSVPLGTSGQQFATGIALAITNLIADTDTTAVVAGQVKVALTYK